MALIGISGKIGSGKDTVGVIIQYLLCLKLNTLAPHQFKFEDFVRSPASNEIQSGFKIKKFADTLKDIVCLLIGCTREQLEDREFKKKELGEEWYRVRLYINDKLEGIYLSEAEIKEKYQSKIYEVGVKIDDSPLTPRLLLQLLGTEAGRNIIHPNIWVNALFSKYKADINTYHHVYSKEGVNHGLQTLEYPNWIITDMRFPNELKAVKDRGGISIRVNRKPFKWIDIESWETETGKKVERVEEHPSETALDNAEFDYVIENDSTIEDLIHTVSLILIKEKII
jgi:hypothetical protein